MPTKYYVIQYHHESYITTKKPRFLQPGEECENLSAARLKLCQILTKHCEEVAANIIEIQSINENDLLDSDFVRDY